MGIKAIDYDDLKEGDLITWYGVHVLSWEDNIRPLGIEPTIAFVQDDTLETENQRLRELLEKALPYLVDYQHIFEGDTIEDLNMLHYFIEDVEEELSDGY